MCTGCGKFFGNILPVSGGSSGSGGTGLPVIVLEGPGIDVQDMSDASEFKFVVSREEVIQLVALLTLVAKESSVVRTSPILKGTIIDELNLSWTYNKVIASQTLTNDGGLTPPVLLSSDLSYNYTGVAIDDNIQLTISGDDGLGFAESTDDDSKSITFGNYMWLGHGLSKINSATSGIEAFMESLTGVIKTSRVHTYNATGGVNQKHFVFYPKVFGLATFTKPPFVGGYLRLKNVAGVLKSELGIGDIESDVIITNSKGYAEAYYLYESVIDNQDDPVTPFIIS